MHFCYNCYTEQETQTQELDQEVRVRGSAITVRTPVPVCSRCGQPVSEPEAEDQVIRAAYREYRRQHGLLQPEEIRAIRQRYGLSQRGLARLFGWGPITVQRYESGALQDPAHNLMIVHMRNPDFVLASLGAATSKLTIGERAELQAVAESLKCGGQEAAQNRTLGALEEYLSREPPSEFTGFLRPSLERLAQMAMYFAANLHPRPLYKVKLMKMWFYADFRHFQRCGVGVSGFPYAALEMGPVPDDFELVLGWIVRSGYGRIDAVPTDANPAEQLIPLMDWDGKLFSTDEVATLDAVADKMGALTGKKLAEISHRESAWIHTPRYDRISYQWAKELKAFQSNRIT